MGLSNGIETPTIVIDLGAPTSLGNMYIWQYGALDAAGTGWSTETERGTATFNVSVSSDSDPNTASYTQLNVTPLSLTELATLNAANAFTNGAPADVFDLAALGDTSSVRLVKIDVVSDHGGDAYTGLAEVAFSAPSTPFPGIVTDFSNFSETGNLLTGSHTREQASRQTA